jgi:predicted O-methyltransferase YrrM
VARTRKPRDQWSAVEQYIGAALLPKDPILESALKASAAADLPSIQISPVEGRLLNLLASALKARRILEIGTLGGYSTIWLARALPPDGALVTIEVDPRHAAVASANIERAGLTGLVDVRVGPALEVLPSLTGPFDLSFIDADKENNAAYFDWALKLSRPGSLIIVDNVVREGAVIDARSKDAMIQGTRRLFDRVKAEPRVQATAIQTVGTKGYDGMMVMLVT